MKWLVTVLFLVTALSGCAEDPEEPEGHTHTPLNAPAIVYGPSAWTPLECDFGGAKSYGLNSAPIDLFRVSPIESLSWFAEHANVNLPDGISFTKGVHVVTDDGNVTYTSNVLRYEGPNELVPLVDRGNNTDWTPLLAFMSEAGVKQDMQFHYHVETVGNITAFTVTQLYQNQTLYVGNEPAQVRSVMYRAEEPYYEFSISNLQRTFYALSLMPVEDAFQLAQGSAECLANKEVAGRPNLNVTQLVRLSGLHIEGSTISYAFTMTYDNGLPCEEAIHTGHFRVDAFTGAILRSDVLKTSC